MSLFKKLFKKKKSNLSISDNVTQHTKIRDIVKMENVSRLIDLVQEAGIAKEIFEMQHEPVVWTIYGFRLLRVSPNLLDRVSFAYTGRTPSEALCKFHGYLISEWKNHAIVALENVPYNYNEFTKFFDNVKYSLSHTGRYFAPPRQNGEAPFISLCIKTEL